MWWLCWYQWFYHLYQRWYQVKWSASVVLIYWAFFFLCSLSRWEQNSHARHVPPRFWHHQFLWSSRCGPEHGLWHWLLRQHHWLHLLFWCHLQRHPDAVHSSGAPSPGGLPAVSWLLQQYQALSCGGLAGLGCPVWRPGPGCAAVQLLVRRISARSFPLPPLLCCGLMEGPDLLPI